MNLDMWRTVRHGRLNDIRRLWQEHGHHPDFYSRFFLPRALEMTGGRLDAPD